MSALSDELLMDQLNAYTRAVIAQWSWDELAQLGHETHVEYRGPSSNLLTFSHYLLEDEPNHGRHYLHVAVSVCDFRNDKGLGSGFQPLTSSFIYYQDGEMDLAVKSTFT